MELNLRKLIKLFFRALRIQLLEIRYEIIFDISQSVDEKGKTNFFISLSIFHTLSQHLFSLTPLSCVETFHFFFSFFFGLEINVEFFSGTLQID